MKASNPSIDQEHGDSGINMLANAIIQLEFGKKREQVNAWSIIEQIQKEDSTWMQTEYQRDAHDYMMLLFNYLETKHAFSITWSYMAGHGLTIMECQKCNMVSKKYTEVRNLLLHLPVQTSVDLNYLIQEYWKDEILDDFKCGNCKQTGGTKQHRMAVKYPKVLSIVFKRHRMIKTKNGGLEAGKITTKVTIPDNLTLKNVSVNNNQKEEKEMTTYMPCGFVYHRGNTVHEGHYIAISRNEMDEWFLCDDENVTKKDDIYNAQPDGFDLVIVIYCEREWFLKYCQRYMQKFNVNLGKKEEEYKKGDAPTGTKKKTDDKQEGDDKLQNKEEEISSSEIEQTETKSTKECQDKKKEKLMQTIPRKKNLKEGEVGISGQQVTNLVDLSQKEDEETMKKKANEDLVESTLFLKVRTKLFHNIQFIPASFYSDVDKMIISQMDKESDDYKNIIFFKKNLQRLNLHKHEKDMCGKMPVSRIKFGKGYEWVSLKDMEMILLNTNKGWLKDSVINYCCNIMKKRQLTLNPSEKINFFCYTFLYSDIQEKGAASSKKNKMTLPEKFSSYKRYYMPCNVAGDHWILVEIDRESRTIMIINSFRDHEGVKPAEILDGISQFLKDKYEDDEDEKDKDGKYRQWNLKVKDDTVQQTNKRDCGLFTITYMDYMSRSISCKGIEINNESRLSLAHTILVTGDTNEEQNLTTHFDQEHMSSDSVQNLITSTSLTQPSSDQHLRKYTLGIALVKGMPNIISFDTKIKSNDFDIMVQNMNKKIKRGQKIRQNNTYGTRGITTIPNQDSFSLIEHAIKGVIDEIGLEQLNEGLVGKIIYNGIGSNSPTEQEIHTDYGYNFNFTTKETSIEFDKLSWSVIIALSDNVTLDYLVLIKGNITRLQMILPKGTGVLFQGWHGGSKGNSSSTSDRFFAYIYKNLENDTYFTLKQLNYQHSLNKRMLMKSVPTLSEFKKLELGFKFLDDTEPTIRVIKDIKDDELCFEYVPGLCGTLEIKKRGETKSENIATLTKNVHSRCPFRNHIHRAYNAVSEKKMIKSFDEMDVFEIICSQVS
jgi:hypothetical protein